MNSGNKAFTIRITGPDGSVRESALDRDNLILGSGPGAAIQIADPKVSAVHLMLKVDQHGVVKVIDLGSEHGTRVGNTVVLAPTPVSHGDVIIAGSSKVEILFGQHSPARIPIAEPAPAAVPAKKHNGFDFGHNQVVAAPKLAPPVPQLPNLPVAQAPRQAQLKAQAPFPLSNAMKAEAPKAGHSVLQVALAWGDQLLGVEHYSDGFPVTIGEGRANEFNVFSPSVGDRFVLVTTKHGKAQLNVPPGARVTVHGAQPRIGEAKTLTLDLHDKAQVDIENVSFLIRHVAKQKHVHAKNIYDLDYGFFKVLGITAVIGISAVLAFIFVPRSTTTVQDNLDNGSMVTAKLLLNSKHTPPPPPMKKVAKQEKGGAEEGDKAKDEEGKMGKEEAKKDQADPSKKGSPIVDPNKKEKDRKKVYNSGLLAALSGKRGDAASDVLGPGGLGSGINNALGGVKGGAGMGDARGIGGLGSRGTGTGGGGAGLGLGGLGTKGDGHGSGGNGLELGKGHETTQIIPGKTTVVGGLSKEVIARVIRQHQQEIKYCYESELNRTPGLAGKVAVGWVIGPDGSVTTSNVNDSSLGNAAVEQCMLTKINRWKFPEVPGGGVVNVTFPWVFKPAGQ